MRTPWLLSLLSLAILSMPVAALAEDDSAALLSCGFKGNISEADQGRFISTAETHLATGQTPKLTDLSTTRSQLSAVAPEVVGCFTAGCLIRSGQALEQKVGYVISIDEDFEIYSITVKVMDLVTGGRAGHHLGLL